MSINRNLINVVILLAIAAFVAIVPAGGWGANFVIQLVALCFLAAMAWIGSRLYREHRVAVYSLGTQRRAIFYGAVAVAIVTLTAGPRLRESGGGTVVFLLLLAGCAFALYRVFRSARTY